MSKAESTRNAIAIVTAALQNGVITLHGPHKSNVSAAEILGTADAKYLAAMLKELTTAIQELP